MPNQLRFIADAATRNEFLSVRVIPFKVGAHPGLSGPFTLLEFDGDLPDLVYLTRGVPSWPSASPTAARFPSTPVILRLCWTLLCRTVNQSRSSRPPRKKCCYGKQESCGIRGFSSLSWRNNISGQLTIISKS
jgi:Domain of unknown function (DUF5753)